MKRFLLLATVALITGTASQAQDQKADSVRIIKRTDAQKEWKAKGHEKTMTGDRVEMKQQNLKQELGLTGAQGQQVKELNQSYAEKMKALRQEQAMNQEEKKAKMKALNAERNEKLKGIVGEEKYKTLEEKRKAMKEEQKGKMKENMKKKRGERAKKAAAK